MDDTTSPSIDPLYALRACEPDFMADPAHEAWLQGEIRRTLAAKAKGRMTYRTLDQAAASLAPMHVRRSAGPESSRP